MKQFWLIRHGQATSNVGERIEYRGAPPLTELGRQQVRHVGKWFPTKPDLIVHSSFVRAQQSAAPLIGRYPDVPVEEWPVQEVTTLPLAEYPNTNWHDRAPRIEQFWQIEAADFRFDGEGSESFADTNQRAELLLETLMASAAECTAVFTHGLFMRFVYWVWLHGSVEKANAHKMEFQPFRRTLYVPNTSIMRGVITDGQLYLSNVQIDHIWKEQ